MPSIGSVAAAAERDAARARDRLLLPPAHEGRDRVPPAAADLAAAQDGVAAAMHELALRQAELDAVTDRIDSIDARIAQMASAKTDGRAREAEALRTGAEVPPISSILIDRQTPTLKRHRRVLSDSLVDLRAAAVARATDALTHAKENERRAASALARAKCVSVAATLVPALVSELAPELNAYRAIEGARSKDYARLLEQIARSIAPVVPEESIRVLGRGPVVEASTALPEPMTILVVREGNNYGGAPAGSHVEVTEQEGALQLRRDPKSGQPLGALQTLAEFEAEQQAKVAAEAKREEARETVPIIKSLVDAGLARISAEGRAKAAAKKEAEERRRRSEEDLARLVAHQLAAADKPTAEERAAHVILDQQGE